MELGLVGLGLRHLPLSLPLFCGVSRYSGRPISHPVASINTTPLQAIEFINRPNSSTAREYEYLSKRWNFLEQIKATLPITHEWFFGLKNYRTRVVRVIKCVYLTVTAESLCTVKFRCYSVNDTAVDLVNRNRPRPISILGMFAQDHEIFISVHKLTQQQEYDKRRKRILA